jgi:hypothetical protein
MAAYSGRLLRPRGAFGGSRDRVVQHDPARAEQGAHAGEIGGAVIHADMLEHADRGDLVVFAR